MHGGCRPKKKKKKKLWSTPTHYAHLNHLCKLYQLCLSFRTEITHQVIPLVAELLENERIFTDLASLWWISLSVSSLSQYLLPKCTVVLNVLPRCSSWAQTLDKYLQPTITLQPAQKPQHCLNRTADVLCKPCVIQLNETWKIKYHCKPSKIAYKLKISSQ